MKIVKELSQDFNATLNEIESIFLKTSFELFQNLRSHENIDEFCENEAFGLLFCSKNDTLKNRDHVAKLLKQYIQSNSVFIN